MSNKEELNIFQETARKFDITEEVRSQMQAALDAAWASEEPASIVLRSKIFPAGKPSLEEFIIVIACLAARETNPQTLE